MSDNLLHATLVNWQGYGILLQGKSGSGKSDVALCLIENKTARLVADDVVSVTLENGQVIGEAPANIQGLLEVRGVGIIHCEYLAKSRIDMVVNLVQNREEIERVPHNKQESILGIEIPAIDLYAMETSVVDKIVVKLRTIYCK